MAGIQKYEGSDSHCHPGEVQSQQISLCTYRYPFHPWESSKNAVRNMSTYHPCGDYCQNIIALQRSPIMPVLVESCGRSTQGPLPIRAKCVIHKSKVAGSTGIYHCCDVITLHIQTGNSHFVTLLVIIPRPAISQVSLPHLRQYPRCVTSLPRHILQFYA